ncbi:hypothetical protein FE257_002699 [Aspergillus nanangensis]|uniref:Uncharacterized protein n=1 Tax=Aspergillus nanangensis TaxID=2582783 RepID=A0AAD4CCE7_ASPNN|nr:hypothetical protein FE257_002699 [Aspergillus nanangensis]
MHFSKILSVVFLASLGSANQIDDYNNQLRNTCNKIGNEVAAMAAGWGSISAAIGGTANAGRIEKSFVYFQVANDKLQKYCQQVQGGLSNL